MLQDLDRCRRLGNRHVGQQQQTVHVLIDRVCLLKQSCANLLRDQFLRPQLLDAAQ